MDFKLISDVRQQLPVNYFGGGPWIHLATVVRGKKEYVAFRHATTNQVYIEEVERNRATFNLLKIEEDAEWADLYKFLLEKGCLLANPEEIKLGKPNE